MWDHAITVGDLVTTALVVVGALVILFLGLAAYVHIQYKREERAYRNRPYDPEEG